MIIRHWARLYQRVTSLLLFSRAMEALLAHEANTIVTDSAENKDYWLRENYSRESSLQLSHDRR